MADSTVDKGRYPIILAHGIGRFDELARRLVPRWDSYADGLHYFRKIRSSLAAAGFTVFHSNVPWAEHVEVRAAALKEQVLSHASVYGKVHIIAHSMGGLDARHMLFNDGKIDPDRIVDKVASLSTLSTPHLGSCVADAGAERFGGLIEHVGLAKRMLAGFFDLTQAACAAFNTRAEPFEKNNDVCYQTFAGVQRDPSRVFVVLRGNHRLITEREGDNDGLVSVASATWRPALFVREPIEADHLNELGWWDPSELWHETPAQLERRIQRFYLDIAEGLCEEQPKRW